MNIAILYLESLNEGTSVATDVVLAATSETYSFESHTLTYYFSDGSKLTRNENYDWSIES